MDSNNGRRNDSKRQRLESAAGSSGHRNSDAFFIAPASKASPITPNKFFKHLPAQREQQKLNQTSKLFPRKEELYSIKATNFHRSSSSYVAPSVNKDNCSIMSKSMQKMQQSRTSGWNAKDSQQISTGRQSYHQSYANEIDMVTHISQTMYTPSTALIIEETQRPTFRNSEAETEHICAIMQEIQNQVESVRTQFEAPLPKVKPNLELAKVEELMPKIESLNPVLSSLPKTGDMIKELEYLFK